MSAPIWVTEAGGRYVSKICEINRQTGATRAKRVIELLEERVYSKQPEQVAVTHVGLGLEIEPILCSYDPFFLHAYLSGKGIPFSLTLVDIDERVIEDVRTRGKIFLPKHFKTFPTWMAQWQDYLARTEQAGWEANTADPELIFIDYIAKNADLLDRYLKGGFKAANVSAQFKADLQAGKVRLVQADIATAELAPGLDFVSMTNVLYLLSPNGQKLALYNIASQLAPGGWLLINDLGYTTCPVLPRHGGWFDPGKQKELGLAIEILEEHKDWQYVLFRKN